MYTIKPVFAGTVGDGAGTTLRAAEQDCEQIICLDFSNRGAAPTTIAVTITKASASAVTCGPATKTLQVNESYRWTWALGHSLGLGDSIEAVAGAADSIDFLLTIAAVTA